MMTARESVINIPRPPLLRLLICPLKMALRQCTTLARFMCTIFIMPTKLRRRLRKATPEDELYRISFLDSTEGTTPQKDTTIFEPFLGGWLSRFSSEDSRPKLQNRSTCLTPVNKVKIGFEPSRSQHFTSRKPSSSQVLSRMSPQGDLQGGSQRRLVYVRKGPLSDSRVAEGEVKPFSYPVMETFKREWLFNCKTRNIRNLLRFASRSKKLNCC